MHSTKRQRQIDATLYDIVWYLYLLHKSGATQTSAVRSLASNAKSLGPAADEFFQVIVDTDSCGCSMFDALERLAKTTPSEKLRLFLSGYIAAVRTSGSAIQYLEETLSSLKSEKQAMEKKYLSSLSIAAEVYMTLFVAAPLFVVITCMVMGLIAGFTPAVPALLMFIVFPLGSICFIIFLDTMDKSVKLEHMKISDESNIISYRKVNEFIDESELFEKIRELSRISKIQDIASSPIKFFMEKPLMILALSAPVSILFSLLPIFSPHLKVVVIFLGTFVPFAIFFSLKEKHDLVVDHAMPNFFQRMADATFRGVPLANAVHLASAEDKSRMAREFYRLSSNISFGDSVIYALAEMASRVKRVTVDRAVIVIRETSKFAVDASETLKLLSLEERERLTVTETRKSEMSMYVTVIYLAFAVYLVVMIIMITVFLDVMSTASSSALGVAQFPLDVYREILLWSVLIHGVSSGFAAGKMSCGSIYAGVKHACILFGAGAFVFFVLGIM